LNLVERYTPETLAKVLTDETWNAFRRISRADFLDTDTNHMRRIIRRWSWLGKDTAAIVASDSKLFALRARTGSSRKIEVDLPRNHRREKFEGSPDRTPRGDSKAFAFRFIILIYLIKERKSNFCHVVFVRARSDWFRKEWRVDRSRKAMETLIRGHPI
jgi:hypothetical protein